MYAQCGDGFMLMMNLLPGLVLKEFRLSNAHVHQ